MASSGAHAQAASARASAALLSRSSRQHLGNDCEDLQSARMNYGDDLSSFTPSDEIKADDQLRLSTPLPPVSLPAFPRPSLSPAASKVALRPPSSTTKQPPHERRGLDLSSPPAPAQSDMSMYGKATGYNGADNDLEDDVNRARQERAARRNQSRDFNADSRDTASARANIAALASAGRGSSAADGGPASLASFMGGGIKPPRLHRIGTGPTEDEQAETDRLEAEMAATRSRWAGRQPQSAASAPPAGIMSLASLMKGAVGGTSPGGVGPGSQSASPTVERTAAVEQNISSSQFTQSPVRETISELPTPATKPIPSLDASHAPAPVKSTSAPPVVNSQASKALGARSLASAFGSSAAGPRINSPSTHHGDDADSGPAHARRAGPGGFALPGMASSSTNTAKDREDVLSREPERKGNAPTSSKRGSVHERWGRDAPDASSSGTPSPGVSPQLGNLPFKSVVETEQPSSAPALTHVNLGRARPPKSTPRAAAEDIAAEPSQTTTSKRFDEPPVRETEAQSPRKAVADRWAGPPIGSKPVSAPRPTSQTGPSEPVYSRGVPLPGMTMPSLPTSARDPPPLVSIPVSPQKLDAVRSSATPSAPGSPASVRNLVASWGKPPASPTFVNAAVKESYGVKISPRPASPVKSRSTDLFSPAEKTELPARSVSPVLRPVEADARSVELQRSTQAAVTAPSFSSAALSKTVRRSRDTSTVDRPRNNALVSKVVDLASTRSKSRRLQGRSLGIDVFSLDEHDPDQALDHNHVLYSKEGVAIVHRAQVAGGEQASLYIWLGADFSESPKTRARIDQIAKRFKAEPVMVRHKNEPRELVEAFGDQLTICSGSRAEFSHLDTALYSIRAEEGVVFVEEQKLTSKSICSGFCTVFSLVGEVYTWYGRGASKLEREACLEFAESLADGRQVNELEEGAETAYFWHGLDGLEYASANYWRFRESHPAGVSIVSINSSEHYAERVDSLALSDSCVTLIDGGYEHFVVVPATARERRGDIDVALSAAHDLADKWQERNLPYRPPCHVLTFPTLVPLDLPHLARGLDLSKLNAGHKPSKMNLMTVEEAREQLL